MAVITDLNGNGVANDPAWAVLGTDPLAGSIAVEARRVTDGASLRTASFLSTLWRGRRVLTTGDIGGNGYEELGVLAERKSDDKPVIQVRDYGAPATTFNIVP